MGDLEAALRSRGVEGRDLEALVPYIASPYGDLTVQSRLPLDDELHVGPWTEYVTDAAERGAGAVLTEKLLQLRFPVGEGVSQSGGYRSAVRGGVAPFGVRTPEFTDADDLELRIHSTLAGKVPVVVAGHRDDFERLVRSLTARNEPVDVPPSMGACLVKGLVNWDRVARHRAAWREARGSDDAAAWSLEMKALAQRKELYQDRLLILSRGSYSAVTPEQAGRDAEEWSRDSLAIRLDHECFHYQTLRLFGLIRSNLLDEILADLSGLLAAHDAYDPRLALLALGVDPGPEPGLLPGGRIEIYRGDPPLDDSALAVLAPLAVDIVENLAVLVEATREDWDGDARARALFVLTMATMDLTELADERAEALALARWRDAKPS